MRLNFKPYGLILSSSPESDCWDSGSVTFFNVFAEPDSSHELFLYYSGVADTHWSRSAIGLAKSADGLKFRKIDGNPLLEGEPGSFCSKLAMTPAVTKIGGNYYMIFAGASHSLLPRPPFSIGIATSDDPGGPWRIIRQIARPTEYWEGRGIDNGPAIINMSKDTILVFYSSNSLAYSDLLVRFLHRPTFDLKHFYRYINRKIGILKIRILGPNNVEVHKHHLNPLDSLNGPIGSWNESLFCPGYGFLNGSHYLLVPTATYSEGYPFPEHIGAIKSISPFFENNSVRSIQKIIDGPDLQIPSFPLKKGYAALDTPNLVFLDEKIFLYYSVMDQSNHVWRIASSIATPYQSREEVCLC
jgi:hypothetical protein